MKSFSDTISRGLNGKTIIIVGDLVADQFLTGTIARVSREAPVFILRHDDTETFAGGAANAAVNIASLGAVPVLIGVTGDDASGELLLKRLADSGVEIGNSVKDPELNTTTKIRVLGGRSHAPRQQIIRIDYENSQPISVETRSRLLKNLIDAGEFADAIVISDYGYGVADAESANAARQISKDRKIPLIIDSRFHLRDFSDATSATPNQEEIEQLLGKNFTAADCTRLREELRLESLLVTCGSKGMLLFENGKEARQIDAVGSAEPVDVTGAGDTVIAVYALALASGLSFFEAAELANHAGGIVVMKKGTAAVTPEELITSIRANAGMMSANLLS